MSNIRTPSVRMLTTLSKERCLLAGFTVFNMVIGPFIVVEICMSSNEPREHRRWLMVAELSPGLKMVTTANERLVLTFSL